MYVIRQGQPNGDSHATATRQIREGYATMLASLGVLVHLVDELGQFAALPAAGMENIPGGTKKAKEHSK